MITINHFRRLVWDNYRLHGRHDLPWRLDHSPYAVLVSELMLQQTQVARVIPKFEAFMSRFPTIQQLAAAELADVLMLWSGLGYNRRARYLWQSAQIVCAQYNAQLPEDSRQLSGLPGIGKNTAGAILAYGFDKPVVFIETNVRTVFLHHFFADVTDVPDNELLTLVERALDSTQPRVWYWALMDYGAYLKAQSATRHAHQRSSHYAKQSSFAGSLRQLRGAVLKSLAHEGAQTLAQLTRLISDDRLQPVLSDLEKETMIYQRAGMYFLGAPKTSSRVDS